MESALYQLADAAGVSHDVISGNETLIVIIIIAVLYVIVTAPQGATSLVLLAALAALWKCGPLNRPANFNRAESGEAPGEATAAAATLGLRPGLVPDDMYGALYSAYHNYDYTPKADYALIGACGERDSSIDSANTLIARQRSRDKHAMDSAAVKDKYYYNYHYADELDEAERKPWWGRNDW